VCESPDHFAAKCPNRKGGKTSANMVISETGGTLGYGNLLSTVLSIWQSCDGGLIRGLIYMHVLMFSYFLLIRSERLPP
jgi:hypothetical protein